MNTDDDLTRADDRAPDRPLSASGPSSELLRRLVAAAPRETRYRINGEIARGGMGAILRVRDDEIGRDLAMKVILGNADPRDPDRLGDSQGRNLARFLEEAQITGQLDHPGIVPVHELGLDSQGRLYFTMKLVKGRELREILGLVRRNAEGWNRTRALGVIQKVCEAVAYAHSKGVIHRDLKPANVMVGEFGEVYVMDWGLARAAGHRDKHDVRLRAEIASAASIRTERRREKEESADSPLVTMDGDVVGTPSYMAPEQAQGRVGDLGPRSDVYSVGAMLYELLTGHMPYVPPGSKISSRTVLAMVLQGPPAPVLKLAPRVPAELAAICEKAMRREASDRYPDTSAMAEDLRAFLENRVVLAHETGAFAELRKWVARNRPLAAVSAVLLIVALLGLSSVLYVQTLRRTEAEQKNVDLAQAREVALANERSARENEEIAHAKAADVLSLSAIQDLQDLVLEADELWPAEPARIEAYESWLERARRIADGLDGHRARLAAIRARASSSAPLYATASADAGAVPASAGFEGTWTTNHGNLNLRADGDRVVGVYMTRGRTSVIDGRADGMRLEFTFKEPSSEGAGWFVLSEDRESLAGQRKDVRSSNWVAWTGRRVERDVALRARPQNLDFEQGLGEDGLPAGWDQRDLRSGIGSNTKIAVDTEVHHGGGACVRMETSGEQHLLDSSNSTISQSVSAESYRGKRLQLSGFLKTAAGTDGAGLSMRVESDVGELAGDYMAQRAAQGETDWKPYTVVHDVPEEATHLTFSFFVRGSGVAWADDLALEVVGTDVPVTTTRKVSAADLALRDEYLSNARSWHFESTEDRWWHNQLERLIADLERFVDPKSGLVLGLSPAHGQGIERRLAFAREIEERTVAGAEAKRLWDEAIESIADRNQCPAYQGLRIRPQLGLLPLSRDRQSGLWEFAHVASGEPPKRLTADKTWRFKPASGLVLVLIPGGEFTIGAQSANASAARYDPAAHANEGPIHTLLLAPFFLSKYEMTQAQWQRLTGENPSNFEAGTALGSQYHSTLHPVEQVSWIDCEQALQRMSLVLPTEAQWEYAARAGTQTPWWTGTTVETLRGAANLPDAAVTRAGIEWQEAAAIPELDDDFAAHAPVDAFRPNPFGLHNVHGNVWEWCRDWRASYAAAARPGDCERSVSKGDARERVIRGGSFNYAPERARSTNRFGAPPTLRMNSVGVRPARALEP